MNITDKLYEKDFYLWTIKNSELLRQRRFDELDTEHIAEEIENMGIGEKHQLINRLGVLVAHLVKWKYGLSYTGEIPSSWKGTILEQRRKIKRLLKDNPSLKSLMDENLLQEIYGDALAIVLKDTGVEPERFPLEIPFSYTTILEDGLYPNPEAL